jgi:heme A synthase
MNGRLVPDLSAEPAAVHFAHRALAALTGVIIAVVASRVIRRRGEMPLQARLAQVALGAFFLEVLIGAINVWTELNAAAVTAHLFVGALVWIALVALAVLSRPAPAAASQRALRRREPALDTAP